MCAHDLTWLALRHTRPGCCERPVRMQTSVHACGQKADGVTSHAV